jgi:hypothetical protein
VNYTQRNHSHFIGRRQSRARGAIQGKFAIRAIDGNSADCHSEMSDEAFLAFLGAHPDLRDRFASIVSALDNSEGNLEQAGAIEERRLEEMRLWGRGGAPGATPRHARRRHPPISRGREHPEPRDLVGAFDPRAIRNLT